MCYEIGLLQAYLDNEIRVSQRGEITKHLATCTRCQEKLQQLESNRLFTDEMLSNYFDSLEYPNQHQVWHDLQKALSISNSSQNQRDKNILLEQPQRGVVKMLKQYRGIAAAACVVLAVSVSLSFSPVRTLAGNFLSIFRVNNFQTVTLSSDDLAQIQNTLRSGAGKVTLGNLGQVDMTRNGESGGVTLAEAKQSVDFPLLLPQTLPSGYTLQGYQKTAGTTLNFTLDTQKTNDVLKSLGATTLLPDSLNGQSFTAQIPVVISASYTGPANLTVSQTRSPQLTTASPEDINTIRDAVLALPFLPVNLRNQLASINDWQHTFVVPNINGSSQNVTVADSPGVFISAPQEAGKTHEVNQRAGRNALLWQKDGVVYAVTGNFTLEQGLSIANSMK